MIQNHSATMRWRVAIVATVSLTLTSLSSGREPTAIAKTATGASGWLRLQGGDHLAGSLIDSPKSDRFVWQHGKCAEPFQFELSHVLGGAFPPSDNAVIGDEGFLVELVGGDRLVGQVTASDERTVTIDASGLGIVKIAKSDVSRISAFDRGESRAFMGPVGLSEWSSLGDKADWKNRGGRLSTETDGASIFRGDVLPEKASIELELSWNRSPGFVLALGVNEQEIESSTQQAYRLEVWEKQFVLLRELDDVADVVSLGKLADFDGILRLGLDLDQVAGTVSCRVGSNDEPVKLKLPPASDDLAQSGIRLLNFKGNVSLDSIQVFPLRSENSPTSTEDDFVATTGEMEFRGHVTGIEDGEWGVVDDETEHRIALADVVEMRFAQASQLQLDGGEKQENEESDAEQERESPTDFHIITHSGSRLTGTWQGISDGRLSLLVDALTEPALVPISQINRVNQVPWSSRSVSPAAPSSVLLELPDGKLRGKLVATPVGTKPTPLRFQANGSTPVTFTRDLAGCLYYVEPRRPESLVQRRLREDNERILLAAQQRQAQRAQRAPRPNLGVLNIFNRAFGNNVQTQTTAQIRTSKSLRLLSGETIPCEIQAIDEAGVTFQSDMTDRTRLPHDIIRAVSLVVSWSGTSIGIVEQERLMTVPRVGKNRPPSHLVIAKNGDLLRCNLIRMTDETIQVETRLETIDIDRALIAEIVWLSNSSEQASELSKDEANAGGLVVRAKMRNGNQLSLIPMHVTEDAIIGSHPYLGDSMIKLSDANELLLGDYQSRTDNEEPFQRWKLRDAPEPMIASDGENGGRSLGTASALVGKPAPDFSLDLLDGDRFKVSEQRGKVLVLDFWATWCGPCLQAMPIIDETVAEFDSEKVILVSVNLQETAEPIRTTLQRLKLSPRVALDIDGVAAARYQADAIPQTVVIGPDGNITRVFVGSGGNLAEQLNTAIEELLVEKPEPVIP